MGRKSGEILSALVFSRALRPREIRALLNGNIDVLGFLPIQVKGDSLRRPSDHDKQTPCIARRNRLVKGKRAPV